MEHTSVRISSAISVVMRSRRCWPAESSAITERRRPSILRLSVVNCCVIACPDQGLCQGRPVSPSSRVTVSGSFVQFEGIMQRLNGKFHILPVDQDGNLDL